MSRSWFGREPPPSHLLPAGERALAWARTSDGAWLLGTRTMLALPERQLRWESVLTAEWAQEVKTLTVVDLEQTTYTFALTEPERLLQLVRERVTASIVLTRRTNLEGKRGFTVMARRPPAGGDIALSVRYDLGLDPDRPDVVAAVRAAVADVRNELDLRG